MAGDKVPDEDGVLKERRYFDGEGVFEDEGLNIVGEELEGRAEGNGMGGNQNVRKARRMRRYISRQDGPHSIARQRLYGLNVETRRSELDLGTETMLCFELSYCGCWRKDTG